MDGQDNPILAIQATDERNKFLSNGNLARPFGGWLIFGVDVRHSNTFLRAVM
jgi:hypothetical protein